MLVLFGFEWSGLTVSFFEEGEVQSDHLYWVVLKVGWDCFEDSCFADCDSLEFH